MDVAFYLKWGFGGQLRGFEQTSLFWGDMGLSLHLCFLGGRGFESTSLFFVGCGFESTFLFFGAGGGGGGSLF